MVPEDLLFWIAPLGDAPTPDPSVLCRRHADAMVVPRGWTLDDRREPVPRLFKPRDAARPKSKRSRSRAEVGDRPVAEQLQIDGTGEIPRTHGARTPDDHVPDDHVLDDHGDSPVFESDHEPWVPEFDVDDDLGGLLEVKSPLLARAFRGTGRRRT